MNFHLLLPEIALAVIALVIICADLLISDKSKSVLGYLAAIALVIPAVLVAVVAQTPGVSFSQTLVVDGLSTFFQFIFLFAAALVLLSSVDFIHRRSRYPGEFFATILFATLGAMFLASGNELITLYVALELMSISQYILAGFVKGD
ncbi:MAG TPA: NADH-quinone oxidoreductase subunit N, partial [Chloroflexota bacterium]|nr:NADH-quinone oxidoreductase subunit N [Chloroflexota bacterium]